MSQYLKKKDKGRMSISDLTYGKENHGYKTQNKLLYKTFVQKQTNTK